MRRNRLIQVKHAPLAEVKRHSFTLSEVKLSNTAGAFSGYGAVFGNLDRVGDVIEKGAFARTLAEWKAKGKWPKMMLQHGGGFIGGAEDLLPCGIWTDMKEDSRGLKVEGQLIALGTERGTLIHEGLKTGALDSLSIGYRARKYRFGTSPDEADRYLEEVDLVEVSIVTFPANEKATISSVKNMTATEVRKLEAILRDEGFTHSEAVTAISCLKKFDAWRHRDGDAESPRDERQSVEEVHELSAEEQAALQSLTAFTTKMAGAKASSETDALLKLMGRCFAA